MLKDFAKAFQPDKETVKASLKEEREKLFANQMKIKDAKLPVMVIFEGWGSAGKGSVIGEVIQNIDPRFFRVATTNAAPTEEEKRKPFLYRYFIQIPEAGKFQFFDTCWMEEVVDGVLDGTLDETTYERRIRSINTAERQLHDNGYLIVKFF
ncbi:MAG: phosphate--AMP phosphotransferase, partial [Lachnospiraceae bacterium]|nr:phosphate--AMP phosphotransferase [Lachnospiraceae bacterium]